MPVPKYKVISSGVAVVQQEGQADIQVYVDDELVLEIKGDIVHGEKPLDGGRPPIIGFEANVVHKGKAGKKAWTHPVPEGWQKGGAFPKLYDNNGKAIGYLKPDGTIIDESGKKVKYEPKG